MILKLIKTLFIFDLGSFLFALSIAKSEFSIERPIDWLFKEMGLKSPLVLICLNSLCLGGRRENNLCGIWFFLEQ